MSVSQLAAQWWSCFKEQFFKLCVQGIIKLTPNCLSGSLTGITRLHNLMLPPVNSSIYTGLYDLWVAVLRDREKWQNVSTGSSSAEFWGYDKMPHIDIITFWIKTKILTNCRMDQPYREKHRQMKYFWKWQYNWLWHWVFTCKERKWSKPSPNVSFIIYQ